MKKLWVLIVPAVGIAAVTVSLLSPEPPVRGAALRYDVELDGHSRAQLGSADRPVVIERRYAIAASIELQPTGEAAGAPMALTFVTVDRANVEVVAKAALDPTGVDGRTFFLDGEDLVAPPDTTLDQRRLAQLVASELAMETSPERTWTAVEPGLLGRVESRYERHGERVERERIAYATLTAGNAADAKVEGSDTIEIEDGRLRSLVGSEEVTSPAFTARASRRIVRVGVEVARPIAPPADAVRHALSAPIVSDANEARAVEDRIDGLTAEQLFADLASHPDGQLPNQNGWVWRATALLRAEPKLAARLVEVFSSPAMQGGGRALVLDLCAAAGHVEAQAAMRAIVELDVVKSDEEASLLFQRFARLEHPDEATLRFLVEARGAATDIHRYTASTVSLGAAAARVPNGDRIVQGLLADLSTERQVDRRRAILTGIGNARYEPAATELAAKVETFGPELRAATASALGRLRGEAARSLALDLVRDPVDLVQVSALRALAEQGLRTEDIARLDPAPLADLALPAFVTLLEPHVSHPDARRALERVLERTSDPRLGARVRELLGAP